MIIDSQSVKTAIVRNEKGFDGGKKVKGRKHHIIVDTLGLILGIVAHEANIHGSVGAKLLLHEVFKKLSRSKVIWADEGYQSPLTWYVFEKFKCALEILERISNKFRPLKKRWIVERTFACQW